MSKKSNILFVAFIPALVFAQTTLTIPQIQGTGSASGITNQVKYAK
ncbi:MAG: hypothetical protein LLF95_08320 [Bacteroidales bacterium]|nr:hypothetical protein [Bacteroidales bacterium]